MNSVALTASAPSPALSAEVGGSEGFEELYRRHSETAWLFAQAVAVDADRAAELVADGFVRTRRRHSSHEGEFRVELLAAVYGRAGDRVRMGAARPEPTGAGSVLHSLPERWRAAVWLCEVESMDPAQISEVLGVSAAEATQLVHLGRRGLAAYYAQAHQPVPEPIGPVLRSVARPVPASLSAASKARWSASARDRQPRSIGGLEQRAVRPLWISVGGLIGLSLIGIGVIAPGHPVPSNLGNNVHASPAGVASQSCYGIPCGSGPAPLGSSIYTAFDSAQVAGVSKL